MKYCVSILILVFSLTIIGCSFSYRIDYEIENNSAKSITITYQNIFSEDIETSIISKGTVLRIQEEEGSGTCTENKVEGLQTIPFKILEIEDEDGKIIKDDLFEITNWDKQYIDEFDRGLVTLTITDESF